MSTDPNLNESTETPRRNKVSRLVIVSWLCLLWVGIAFCALLATFDHLDVYDNPEWRPPYQWLVECIVLVGLIATPVGFICGLCALLFRKDPEFVSFLPIFVLGLLLAVLTSLLCHAHLELNQTSGDPPIIVPVDSD